MLKIDISVVWMKANLSCAMKHSAGLGLSHDFLSSGS